MCDKNRKKPSKISFKYVMVVITVVRENVVTRTEVNRESKGDSLQKPFHIHIFLDCNYDANKHEPLYWFGLEDA
jgi:hypothetical protein